MHRRLVGMVVLFLVLLPWGCAAPKKRPSAATRSVEITAIPGGLDDVHDAVAAGDPVRALGILKGLEAKGEGGEMALALREEATTALDKVVAVVLASAQREAARFRFAEARGHYRYLQEHMPLAEDQRQVIDQALAEMDTKEAAARESLQRVRAEVEEMFAAGEHQEGVAQIKKVWRLAMELDRPLALHWEIILLATSHRQEAVVVAKRRRPKGKSSPKKREAPAGGFNLEGASLELGNLNDPEQERREVEVRGLVAAGKKARARKAFFDAIRAFDSALALDPENAAANAAVGALKKKRQELVQEYITKADAYFLSQDLAAAAPYYRKVLVLEPTNKKAAKGLSMYENLQAISNSGGS